MIKSALPLTFSARPIRSLWVRFALLSIQVLCFGGLGLAPSAARADESVSCECEAAACGACEVETGVKFYSDKCGPGLSRVKSCKKPTCVPYGGSLESKNQCLSQLKSDTDPASASSNAARAPASGKVDDSAVERAGEVTLAVGNTAYRRATDEKLLALTTGHVLRAGDEIVTGDDGRVRVRFPELSEIFVGPKTNLRITEATGTPTAPKRKVLLNLIQGKVRSRVQGRRDSSGSRFEVYTRTAVAGVRGTDFVTSYERSASTWTTEVRTLEGEVRLKGLNSGSLESSVTALTYAAHVVPAPSESATAKELDEMLSKSYLTPVFKLTDEDRKRLDEDMLKPLEIPRDGASLDPSKGSSEDRKVASNLTGSQSDGALCSAPAAGFNQCSWSCEGNPKGSEKCRTELKGVKCVRRLCRANGKWAEPTVMAPSESSQCDARGPIVGDCGGYW